MKVKRNPINCLEDMVFVVFVFASLAMLGMAIAFGRLEQRVEALEAKEQR